MFTLICVYLFVETDQIGGGCTEENEGHLHVVRTKANSLQSESVNANVSSDERERERALPFHILKCHFPKSLLQKPTLILFVVWICDIMTDWIFQVLSQVLSALLWIVMNSQLGHRRWVMHQCQITEVQV